MSTVLVTGGNGWLASHVIRQLLHSGHRVRTTMRRTDQADALREALRSSGIPCGEENLPIFEARLESSNGWEAAVEGCDYVQHVASPLPLKAPRHRDEVIVPARLGVLHVLKAAAQAGVKRVVLTSSTAAISYGHPERPQPFDEHTWTQLDGGSCLSAYIESKTLAERAAWEFITADRSGLELSVVNPTVILGPLLTAGQMSSVMLVKRLLDGLPGNPRMATTLVDVRDVAMLHELAMTHPAAAGERFIASSGDPWWLQDLAAFLQAERPALAQKVTTRVVPDWLFRAVALVHPTLRAFAPELGKVRRHSHDKATRLLGWQPRPPGTSLLASADSLHDFGLLR